MIFSGDKISDKIMCSWLNHKIKCCTSLGLPPGLRARLLEKSGESTADVLSWPLWYCPSLVVRRLPISCVTSGVIPLERTPVSPKIFEYEESSNHYTLF